jgi:NTE family protein
MKEAVSKKQRRVGLALGGGVARGIAHIGVLQVLNEAGIEIDFVAGSSAGSIIGASYCAGRSIEEIFEIGMRMRWWHIARPVWPSRGLVSFAMLEKWLINYLGDLQFAQLHIPYAAVATDLDSGEPVVLQEGRLAPAIRASCSIPGIVTPVEIDGRVLGDGCLSDTVPVDVLRSMGADLVIGVDLFKTSMRPGWGAIGLGLVAIEILLQRAGGGIDDADILITPDLAGASYVRFSRREWFYKQGKIAATDALDTIRAKLHTTIPETSVLTLN